MANPVQCQVTKSPETQAGCRDIQEARISKGQLTMWREHASTECVGGRSRKCCRRIGYD
jgi:hypothetical protein